jgi:hypothetical protein
MELLSALITLHDPEANRTDFEHFEMAMTFLRPVVDQMAWASGVWFGERLVNLSDASPLLIFWAYQAITIYHRLEGQYGNEVQQHLLLMKEKLKIMSQRWKAGGMGFFFSNFMHKLMLIRGIFTHFECSRNYTDGRTNSSTAQ